MRAGSSDEERHRPEGYLPCQAHQAERCRDVCRPIADAFSSQQSCEHHLAQHCQQEGDRAHHNKLQITEEPAPEQSACTNPTCRNDDRDLEQNRYGRSKQRRDN